MSETSKGFIATNWFKLFFAALSLFLVALYFYRESQLDQCLRYTQDSYSQSWDGYCKKDKKDNECSLPLHLSETLKKDRDRLVNECFRRYSFK